MPVPFMPPVWYSNTLSRIAAIYFAIQTYVWAIDSEKSVLVKTDLERGEKGAVADRLTSHTHVKPAGRSIYSMLHSVVSMRLFHGCDDTLGRKRAQKFVAPTDLEHLPKVRAQREARARAVLQPLRFPQL